MYKYADIWDSVYYDRYSTFIGNGNSELIVYDNWVTGDYDKDIRLDDKTTYFGIGRINANGSTGNHILWGDEKNNQIIDGSGNSNLWGGWLGDDTLTGGLGADTFLYNYNGGHDVITDANSNDTIWLFNTNLSDFRYYWYDNETNVMSLCLGTNGWQDGWLEVHCSTGDPYYPATYPVYQFADGTRLTYVNGWQYASWDTAADTGAEVATNPLWGDANTYYGTANADNIFVSKNNANDLIFNAAQDDTIHFCDAVLSDIVATAISDNAVAIAFNTGETAVVATSENISPTFKLASGESYIYNREASAWQKV